MNRFARHLVVASGFVSLYALLEPHFLRVRRFDVAIENLPDDSDALRVAHLSDLHCSAITSPAIIRRAVQKTNAQKPDVIVLTGDFMSRPDSLSPFLLTRLWAKSPRFYAQQIAAELKNLRASLGIVAVRGNHDAAAGEGFFREMLEACGVQLLVNSSTRISGLPFVGLDDLRIGRVNWKTAFAGIENDEAQIVLSHNPRVLPLLQKRNVLILGGHTHGGQVHLPLVKRHRPFDMRGSAFSEGWYQDERARMFVNAGIGSVHVPIRFMCPPEIAILTLKKRTHFHHEHEHH